MLVPKKAHRKRRIWSPRWVFPKGPSWRDNTSWTWSPWRTRKSPEVFMVKIHGVLRRLSNCWSLGEKNNQISVRNCPFWWRIRLLFSCCIFFDEEVIFSAVWSWFFWFPWDFKWVCKETLSNRFYTEDFEQQNCSIFQQTCRKAVLVRIS